MFILKSISQTVLPLLAATFLASTPLVTATEASGINPRYVTDQNVIYAKGGGKGGISGTFNNAAKGPKPPVQKWTTKPRLPLWKGQNPQAKRCAKPDPDAQFFPSAATLQLQRSAPVAL